MTKVLMAFYSSLILFGALQTKGCGDNDVVQDIPKQNLAKETVQDMELDKELKALLLGQSDGSGLAYYTLPYGSQYDSYPQDPKNPLSSFKVLLGKKLFCEPALAIKPLQVEATNTYSCASCHIPSIGFSAGIRQGIGEGGIGFGEKGEGRIPNKSYEIDDVDVQPIRTPSIVNGAYNRTSIWNGQFGAVGPNEGTESNWDTKKPTGKNFLGFHGVETQAIAGMDVHRLGVDEDFIKSTYYKEWFDQAFPEIAESDRYTSITAGLAIAAFERTVVAQDAPFQEWLRGEESTMTDHQKKGALLFFGKAKCNSCHNGPALNSEEFIALGMKDFGKGEDVIIAKEKDFENALKGRAAFTKREEDMFKFKTPQLYSLRDQGFYGHGGTFTSIRDIIAYKNKGVKENPNVPDSQIAAEFQPLGLSDEEIDQLADFVENALQDDGMSRYAPSGVASGMCFPNNDNQSKLDMNCGMP